MSNYHITKKKDSGMWQAKRAGAERAGRLYNTQVEAEKAAKEFSANSGGEEVRIHRPSGPIRDSDTVAPGNDPCPPKDTKF
ncbi:DUF2188 domain-containing protein [Pseudomonadota bacterium]